MPADFDNDLIPSADDEKELDGILTENFGTGEGDPKPEVTTLHEPLTDRRPLGNGNEVKPTEKVETPNPEEKGSKTPEKDAKESLEDNKPDTGTPVTDPKPAEAVKTPEKPSDSELDAFQAPKGITPTNKKGWEELKEKVRVYREKAQTYEKELIPLRERAKQAAAPEMEVKVKQLENDLQSYKMLFRKETDTDFQEKYDKAITKNDEAIYNVLKKYGAKPEVIDALQKGGGSTKYRNWIVSNILNGYEAGEDGRSDPTKPIIPDPIDKAKIIDALKANEGLAEQRQSELDSIPKNREEFTKKETEARKTQYESYQKELSQHVIEKTKGVAWANPMEVPANATPEQKASIEKHNQEYKMHEQRFSLALYPKNAQTRAEVAMAATYAYKLADDLVQSDQKYAALQKEFEEVQKQLNDIKKAGITSRAQGAPHIKSGGRNGTLDDRIAMKDDDAIEAGLRDLGL